MIEEKSENLSEILFKPKIKYPETTTISNSDSRVFVIGEEKPKWFRNLHLMYWKWLGFDAIEIMSVLAKIAASDGERTRPGIYDSVRNYNNGNWNYEFSAKARDYESLANGLEEDPNSDKEEEFRLRRLSYLYFNLAAYPYLKGDILAEQALMLHYKNYKKATSYLPGDFKEFVLEVDSTKGKKNVNAFFHTPDSSKMLPCLLIFSNYQSLSTEYLRFYKECLYPLGVAMMAVDMPGIGLSVDAPLDLNTGYIHEAALKKLLELNCVNSARIGILAQRLGANAACHVMANYQSDIRCACFVTPIVHTLFTDQKVLSQAPSMLRSILANRMDTDASSWDYSIPRLQVYSVERQGFMQGIKFDIPLKIIGTKLDALGGSEDLKICASYSKKSDITMLKGKSANEQFQESIDVVCDFIKKELAES